MTRCGGCDNKLWCRTCAREYMSSREVLEQDIANAKLLLEEATSELRSTVWDEKGEPV